MRAITGSIQGFNCVTQGKVCPIGKEDPVLADENVFVLLVDAAKADYYVIGNVDRAILARHFNEEVKIDGKVNAKTKSIAASDLYTMDRKRTGTRPGVLTGWIPSTAKIGFGGAGEQNSNNSIVRLRYKTPGRSPGGFIRIDRA